MDPLESVQHIRRLGPDDAPSLAALRRQALESDPLAFGSAPGEDRFLAPEAVAAYLAAEADQAVFGAFQGPDLAGMAGVLRTAGAKRQHRAFIWGMYVVPEARRMGAGRALLEAAVAQARAWPGIVQVHLSVTEAATAARRLYESAGFRVWGREPRALLWEGRFVDEIHLVYELTGS